MLKYKIKEILLATGKRYPAKWLEKQCGFNKHKAQNIINGKQTMFSFADLSIICEALYCTPNNIMYWENKPTHLLHALHPLITDLKPPTEIPALDTMLKKLPMDKVMEVNAIVRQILVQAQEGKQKVKVD